MQNNFREFEELVFFDLRIPDSGFRIPDSGFRFPGFRVAPDLHVQHLQAQVAKLAGTPKIIHQLLLRQFLRI